MFDKGFLPDIRRILKHVPVKRQTLIFSATMPGEVRHLVEDILCDPVTVQIDYEKLIEIGLPFDLSGRAERQDRPAAGTAWQAGAA